MSRFIAMILDHTSSRILEKPEVARPCLTREELSELFAEDLQVNRS